MVAMVKQMFFEKLAGGSLRHAGGGIAIGL